MSCERRIEFRFRQICSERYSRTAHPIFYKEESASTNCSSRKLSTSFFVNAYGMAKTLQPSQNKRSPHAAFKFDIQRIQELIGGFPFLVFANERCQVFRHMT